MYCTKAWVRAAQADDILHVIIGFCYMLDAEFGKMLSVKFCWPQMPFMPLTLATPKDFGAFLTVVPTHHADCARHLLHCIDILHV